ncbi:MAG: DUF371 domain-containing protein [Candidatus Methylarchaceae archaeon HK02M2]|nr:DUF371 domain-containing protein [Candidatus Methylarchaceae archaeon HK02M2]
MMNNNKHIEIVDFFGHPLIKATHKTTFEITKDTDLSKSGDCIIGIKANKSCIDINEKLKKRIKQIDVPIKITIYVGKHVFIVNALGHPSLMLNDDKDIVVRKSNYVCPRTLAICSTRAAEDLPRYMVRLLRKKETKGKMIITTL